LPLKVPLKNKGGFENVVVLNWLSEHSDTPIETTRKIWEFVTDDWNRDAVLQLVPEHHINWHRIWSLSLDGYYEREKVVKGERWTYRSRIRYYSNSNEINVMIDDTHIEFMDDSLAVQFKLSNDL
jgi:hypothetical protein